METANNLSADDFEHIEETAEVDAGIEQQQGQVLAENCSFINAKMLGIELSREENATMKPENTILLNKDNAFVGNGAEQFQTQQIGGKPLEPSPSMLPLSPMSPPTLPEHFRQELPPGARMMLVPMRHGTQLPPDALPAWLAPRIPAGKIPVMTVPGPNGYPIPIHFNFHSIHPDMLAGARGPLQKPSYSAAAVDSGTLSAGGVGTHQILGPSAADERAADKTVSSEALLGPIYDELLRQKADRIVVTTNDDIEFVEQQQQSLFRHNFLLANNNGEMLGNKFRREENGAMKPDNSTELLMEKKSELVGKVGDSPIQAQQNGGEMLEPSPQMLPPLPPMLPPSARMMLVPMRPGTQLPPDALPAWLAARIPAGMGPLMVIPRPNGQPIPIHFNFQNIHPDMLALQPPYPVAATGTHPAGTSTPQQMLVGHSAASGGGGATGKAVKGGATGNKFLLAKIDALQAQNAEQKAQIDELKTKLELVELKTKLEKEETAKLVETKMREMLHENESKFIGMLEVMLADRDKKVDQLEKEVKQMHLKQVMTTLGGKVDSLESQKQLQLSTKTVSYNNKWDKRNADVTVSGDGLTVTKTGETFTLGNVMAKFAYSAVYFEVLVIQEANRAICIGVSATDCTAAYGNGSTWVGEIPGSICICSNGYFYNSGSRLSQHFSGGFGINDTIGFGIAILPGTEQRVFFATKNGEILGKPIPLASNFTENFYPSITLCGQRASVEVNFGNDLVNKPFSYNIAEHKFS